MAVEGDEKDKGVIVPSGEDITPGSMTLWHGRTGEHVNLPVKPGEAAIIVIDADGKPVAQSLTRADGSPNLPAIRAAHRLVQHLLQDRFNLHRELRPTEQARYLDRSERRQALLDGHRNNLQTKWLGLVLASTEARFADWEPAVLKICSAALMASLLMVAYLNYTDFSAHMGNLPDATVGIRDALVNIPFDKINFGGILDWGSLEWPVFYGEKLFSFGGIDLSQVNPNDLLGTLGNTKVTLPSINFDYAGQYAQQALDNVIKPAVAHAVDSTFGGAVRAYQEGVGTAVGKLLTEVQGVAEKGFYAIAWGSSAGALGAWAPPWATIDRKFSSPGKLQNVFEALEKRFDRKDK